MEQRGLNFTEFQRVLFVSISIFLISANVCLFVLSIVLEIMLNYGERDLKPKFGSPTFVPIVYSATKAAVVSLGLGFFLLKLSKWFRLYLILLVALEAIQIAGLTAFAVIVIQVRIRVC